MSLAFDPRPGQRRRGAHRRDARRHREAGRPRSPRHLPPDGARFPQVPVTGDPGLCPQLPRWRSTGAARRRPATPRRPACGPQRPAPAQFV